MPIRKTPLIPEQYYHIYNRGNNRQTIFFNDRDRARFLAGMLVFQAPPMLVNSSRDIRSLTESLVQPRGLDNSETQFVDIARRRSVTLVAFTLMPNHFHLIVHERSKGGVTQYLGRLLNSYTKYHNTKREAKGHVFEGPFHAVHIEDDDQLCYLSAYIHRNPRELKEWYNREHEYPWSSYQDYLKENRWGELLNPDIIIDQVGRGARYQRFVERSGAKTLLMDPVLHID